MVSFEDTLMVKMQNTSTTFNSKEQSVMDVLSCPFIMQGTKWVRVRESFRRGQLEGPEG